MPDAKSPSCLLHAFKPNECPNVIHKGNVDVSWDVCDINRKSCVLESDDKCETYEEFKLEQAEEDAE